MAEQGTFVWNDLASADAEAAKAFYAEVLGWKFESFALPGGPYRIPRAGGAIVGGIGGPETGPAGTTTSTWVSWIEVDDVDARVASARASGGAVVEEPHDTPGVGRVAVIRDPTGGVIGLMTSANT